MNAHASSIPCRPRESAGLSGEKASDPRLSGGFTCVQHLFARVETQTLLVVPAKAGTHASSDVRMQQRLVLRKRRVGPRFRGDDKLGDFEFPRTALRESGDPRPTQYVVVERLRGVGAAWVPAFAGTTTLVDGN